MPHEEEFVFKPANSPKTTTEASSPTSAAKPTLSHDFPQLNALIDLKISEFQAKFQQFSSALCKESGQADTNAAFEIEDVPDEQPEATPTSPLTDNKEDLDEKERELFATMKATAAQFWSTQRAQWTSQHQSHLLQQSARLSASNDLQERLLHAGRDFDLKLFEEVVGACGRGRDSVYGRERMARFWECLLRDGTGQAEKADDLLQDLLGMQ